jgi:O-antigen/teichoic acid export membrane protein
LLFRNPMSAAEINGARGPWDGVLRSAFSAGTAKLSWDLGSRVLSFALSVLVARRLGAEAFGTYAVYWYSAWMASQATDLGIHLVSLRSLSRAFEPRLFWSAVAAKSALTVLVLAATLAAFGAGAFSDAFLLWLVAAHLAATWAEFVGVTLRSRGLFAREGLVLTLLRVGWLAAAAVALSRSTGLEPLAVALALASLPALALALILLRGIRPPPREGIEATRLLREALPLGLVSAMTILYLRADLFLVAAIAGAAEAGFFQSAFRLFEAAFVVSGGVAAGTFPLLASRFGDRGFETLARFVLGLLVLLSAPIALAFSFVPAPILDLVYGGGFEGGARPLSLLGVALVAVFANALTTHLLVASGRSRRLVLSIALRLAVGVTLDVLLIPRWGAAGAAFAVLAAESSLLVVTLGSTLDLLFPFFSRRALPREEVSPCS